MRGWQGIGGFNPQRRFLCWCRRLAPGKFRSSNTIQNASRTRKILAGVVFTNYRPCAPLYTLSIHNVSTPPSTKHCLPADRGHTRTRKTFFTRLRNGIKVEWTMAAKNASGPFACDTEQQDTHTHPPIQHTPPEETIYHIR